jgi:hypothetical protein
MKRMIAVLAMLATGAVVTASSQAGGGSQSFEYSIGTPVQDRIVAGAPYSAQFVSEHIQTLSDGNRIVRRTTGRVYRDKDGRVRRETDRASGEPLVTITDPVAKTSVTLDPARRTARSTSGLLIMDLKEKMDALRMMTPSRSGGSGTTTRQILTPASGGGRGGGGVGASGAGGVRGRAANDVTEEKLADKIVEGVNASGRRKVTTIAQGAIGNERPIEIVSEEWTSTELQVLVLTDLNDPRSGRSTYRLFSISRSNPAASLFEIPAGYTIVKEPSPDWVIKNLR